MNCSRCGRSIKIDDYYCSKCGIKVNRGQLSSNLGGGPIRNEIPVMNPYQMPNVTPVKKESKAGTVSLTLGIVSIVLCFLGPLDLVAAIIGLIMGIIAVKKTKEKAGLILSIIGIILSILLTIGYFTLFAGISNFFNGLLDDDFEYMDVEGDWYCLDEANNKAGKKDYEKVLKLNGYDFDYYGYKDKHLNYITGTYTYNRLNSDNNYSYYALVLTGEGTIVVNGESKSSFKNHFEMGINKKDESESTLTDVNSGKKYICYRS